jgi:hypothetical protein
VSPATRHLPAVPQLLSEGWSPRDRREFFVGLGNDGQRARVRVEDGVQPLRFAERIASQGGD